MSPGLYAGILMVCVLYMLSSTAFPQTEGNNPTFRQEGTSHHCKTTVRECPNHRNHNDNYMDHVH
jgi:hypothetical protein